MPIIKKHIYRVVCDVCGTDLFETVGTANFDKESYARDTAVDHGWWCDLCPAPDADDKIICFECVGKKQHVG